MYAADAILDYAMKFLREQGDRFVWVENGREGLAALVDLIFELDTDPMPLLDEMLTLASAVDKELRSPEAAAILMAVLGTDPRVGAIYSREPTHKKRENAARWAGSEEVKQGPRYGAEAPAGTISAAALIEQRRMRLARELRS